jgi:hypothetical protein
MLRKFNIKGAGKPKGNQADEWCEKSVDNIPDKIQEFQEKPFTN